MAQKEFTLEELNFGGKNYRKMVPEYRHYKWKGEMPVRADKHEEPQTNEPQIVKEDDCVISSMVKLSIATSLALRKVSSGVQTSKR